MVFRERERQRLLETGNTPNDEFHTHIRNSYLTKYNISLAINPFNTSLKFKNSLILKGSLGSQ